MTARRLVVVGAGITGLAAAFEWRRRRPDDEIVVLEAGDRIGGKLHRVELAGHWYDTGPEAVLARVPEAVAAGRGASAWPTGWSRPRPRRRPSSCPTAGTRCPAGTVLGVPAVGRRPGRRALPPDGVARVRAEADAAAAAARRRRRRRRAAARAARRRGGRPAGRAAARRRLRRPGRRAVAGRDHAGAGRAAARPPARCWPPRRPRGTPATRSRGDADGPVFATVADGIGVAARRRWSPPSGADVRLRTPAHGAPPDGGRLRALRRPGRGAGAADRGRRARHRARARRPPGCWPTLAPGAVEPLQGIPYASMAVVAMAFPAQDVAAGSGLLVPPVTGRLVKGVTVSSAKWPHLAGDALLVRSSVGRFRDEAELQRSDDDLTAAVVADVADLLDLARPEPLETRLVRWGGGLPQYLVGHPARVAAIRAAVARGARAGDRRCRVRGRRRAGLHPRRPPRRRLAARAEPWRRPTRRARASRTAVARR